MEIMAKTKHLNETATVRFAEYENGRVAIQLLDCETGEPLTVATVNLPDIPLSKDHHTFIKDWSENEGMLACLVREGIVEDTGIRQATGYVEAALCKWTVRAQWECQKGA